MSEMSKVGRALGEFRRQWTRQFGIRELKDRVFDDFPARFVEPDVLTRLDRVRLWKRHLGCRRGGRPRSTSDVAPGQGALS